jgi:hypothetical protein
MPCDQTVAESSKSTDRKRGIVNPLGACNNDMRLDISGDRAFAILLCNRGRLKRRFDVEAS